MTQTCTTRMFQIARNDPSSCSKLLSVAKSCSKLFKIAQNASKCFIFSKCIKMHQHLSKGMMCLHMQVRKLSLLGIAVAGVYCCMGLRSVSIAHDATFRPLNPSISTDRIWQGIITLLRGRGGLKSNISFVDTPPPIHIQSKSPPPKTRG